MTHAVELCCALIVAVVTLACGADAPTPTKVTGAAEPEGADAVAEQEAVAGDGVVAADGGPRITADEAVHDFGAIKGTDTVEHVFKIRNTGSADLVIDHVQKT